MHESRFEISDDQLHLGIKHDANTLIASLTVIQTGRTWGPSSLIALEVHDRTVRREDRVERFELLAVRFRTSTELRLVLGRQDIGLEFELWLRITNGELIFSFHPLEMYETRDQHFRVFSVDMLPGLVTVGAAGHILLPCATGMVTSPYGKPAVSDRFLIYMEQSRWELTPLLPIVAAEDSQGGLTLIATEGDCDAEVRVRTDGKGNGSVGMGAMLRQSFWDPMDPMPRRVLFSPIGPGDDLVHAAAKRLRRHVIEDRNKPTIKQRAEQSPEVQYMLDSMTMKTFYGMQNLGLERTDHLGEQPTYNAWMTFDECGQWMSRLHELGLEKIHFMHTAWTTRGHDGLWPSRFPVEERIGGQAGFERLIQHGQSLGYRMGVHDNFMCNVVGSPGWEDEVIVQDEAGRPMLHGWWGGGLEYTCWPLAFEHHRLDGVFEQIKALGVEGPYYCDYMMQPLEVNHHPKHRGPRSEFNRGMQHILERAANHFGSSATEMGTLPGALACDYVTTCSSGYHLAHWRDDWPIISLRDQVVPLWQLTLQGLVICESQSGSFWYRTLEAALWGRTFRDEWQAHPGKHPVMDQDRAQQLAAIYPIVQEQLGYLKALELTKHEMLSEHAQRSTFEDGSVVEVDFNDQTLRVNSDLIDPPSILTSQTQTCISP